MPRSLSRRFVASAAILLVGLGAFAAAPRVPGGTRASRENARAPAPSGPRVDDVRSLRVATIAAISARGDASYAFVEEHGGARAMNREGSLEVCVTRHGRVTIAGDGTAPTTLTLARVVRGSREAAPRASALSIEGSLVSLDRGDGATEWYRNGPLGLEQGFDFARRPEGEGALTLELSVDGAQVRHDDEGGVLLAALDGSALRYDELHVVDADGRFLDARLEAHGSALAIVVDDAGARYPIRVDPLIVPLEGTLTAKTPFADDALGTSVDVEGDYAVVGAPNRAVLNYAGAGAALLFARSGTTWSFVDELVAPDASQGARFGTSVSLRGSLIAVGAPSALSTVGSTKLATGAVYVFAKTGIATQPFGYSATLLANDGASGAELGASVALDGSNVVAGAPSAGGAGATSGPTGAAYYFVTSGTAYAQFAKLLASDGAPGDRFGASVSASGGVAVLVGAPKGDRTGASTVTDSGAAYVFARTSPTATFSALPKLVAADGAAGDEFGASVAIVGADAIVGAPRNDNVRGADAGAVYLFGANGSTYVQQRKLFARNAHGGDMLGASVDLAVGANGAIAVAGAPGTKVGIDASPEGIGYLFVRKGIWFEAGNTQMTDVVAGGLLGASIAVDRDTIVAGAPADSVVAVQKAGTARAFRVGLYRVLTVAVAGQGSGTVTSMPDGIACAPDCIAAFATDARVTLTPTPAAGSTFVGWSGDCTGTGPCAVTMSADHTVIATFEKIADAGVGDAGADGGALDSGVDAGTDASIDAGSDASIAPPDVGFSGRGGCSASGSRSSAFGTLVLLVCVAVARRRARAGHGR